MFPSSGESTRQSQFKIGGECTWYALIASSRKTKRAKHPARHSLLARFQGLGITISSTWPNGSRSAFTAYHQYNSLTEKGVYRFIDSSFFFGDIQCPVDSCTFHPNHTSVKTSL